MSTLPAKDDRSNDVFEATSFLYGSNALFIEQQLALYLQDPNSVDESWRAFFAAEGVREAAHRPSWARTDWQEPTDDDTRSLIGAPPLPKVDPKAKAAKAAPQP